MFDRQYVAKLKKTGEYLAFDNLGDLDSDCPYRLVQNRNDASIFYGGYSLIKKMSDLGIDLATVAIDWFAEETDEEKLAHFIFKEKQKIFFEIEDSETQNIYDISSGLQIKYLELAKRIKNFLAD